jgi:peroxiredoxin Q/BCP
MTPTCTVEACNLRDHFLALTIAGIEVIGISPDDEASHVKFIEKQQLPYHLLADTDHATLEKYGVWGEKSMYGRKYMGVLRTTFLIDEAGKIAHIIDKVKSKEHAQQILKLWQ